MINRKYIIDQSNMWQPWSKADDYVLSLISRMDKKLRGGYWR